MIQLAFAGFLVGLAGLAVPIILHFLKNKPTKKTSFPSLRFLHATVARRTANNKLRKRLILLLRCICLAALALAFCMPYLARFAQSPDSATIVLWDHSFSMQAEPHAAPLKKLCLNLLNRADATHPVLFGAVSDRVVWSGKFTGDAAELGSFFKATKPGEGTGSFENALRMADARLAVVPGKKKEIVIVTDRQALPWKTLQWKRKLSPGILLRVVSPQDGSFINAAVTDLTLQTPYRGPSSKVALSAQLKNFSDQSMQGRLVCLLDGEEVAQTNVALPPGSETTHSLEFASQKERHGVEVRLEVGDELATDNCRRLALNPTPLPTIAATPPLPGSIDFLQLAFNPTKTTASANWKEWNADQSSEQITQTDLLIIRNANSLGFDAMQHFTETIEQGGSAILIWDDSPEMRNLLLQFGVSVDLLPKKQTKELDFINFDHPVFKPFLEAQVGGFFNILYFNPPVLHLPESAQILAGFKDGTPAIAELSHGQGKLMIVACAMDRRHTDWPTYATYLPFWREMLDHCMEERNTAGSFRVSSSPIPIPGLLQARRLESGENLVIKNSRLPADKAGTYLINADTNPRMICINVPPEESNPEQLNKTTTWEKLISDKPAETIQTADLSMDQGKSFWRALFLVAILAAFAEMLIANRTVL